MTHNQIFDKLIELNADGWLYPGENTICLNGEYTIEELKLFIKLIELGVKEKQNAEAD